MYKGHTNLQFGYPPDARLLLINADDFGMCNSVNEAIIQTIKAGLVRSTSLMVACPWASHAMHFLAEHPEIPFGVHLTVVCDADDYKWGPLTPWDKVPSLVDKRGHFHRPERFCKHMDRAGIEQLEMEFRLQIETVLEAGLKPAHLDWHYLRLEGEDEIYGLMLKLAREYGLTFRAITRSMIEYLQNQGLPTVDHEFLDSYLLGSDDKRAKYARLLRELPEGLSEWGVHPGLDNAELLALEPDGEGCRQLDYDFLMSPLAQEIVEQEGIILVDYRPLQAAWNSL